MNDVPFSSSSPPPQLTLPPCSTNGALPCQPISHKMKHSYILRKQPKATGVSPIVRDLSVSISVI